MILLIAFGAIIAAGVPLLLALSAVGAATGLSVAGLARDPRLGIDLRSMILLMGMAVGVDYSLFYVKRARAERHARAQQARRDRDRRRDVRALGARVRRWR